MESASVNTPVPLGQSVLIADSLGDASSSPRPDPPGTGARDPAATGDERASKRPFLIAGLVLLAGITALAVHLERTRGNESTEDAQVERDVVAISVRAAGLVVSVPAPDNRRIRKGDLIAQIDDTDYRARLQQARAELAQAQALAEQAEAQELLVAASARGGMTAAQAQVSASSFAVRGALADIAHARAVVEGAEVDVKSTELELARNKMLRAADAVPQSRLDEVQLAADRARASLAQARARLDSAEEEQHAVDARVSEAQGRLTQSAPVEVQLRAARANTEFQRARIASAEAAVTLAQSQLDATKVVAPADGLLTNLSLHAGVLASVGTPVALLVPPEVYVIANFKETQLGSIRSGQPVEVVVDALGSRRFEGRVDTIAGGTQGRFSLLPADNSAGNFVKVVQRVPVYIRLVTLADDFLLLPGLSADVTVHVR